MNPTQALIAQKLEEIEPSLDILGNDKKVIDIAVQDFTNYIKFIKSLQSKNKKNRTQETNSQEIREILTFWAPMWLKKWKSRFSLLLTNPPKATEQNSESTVESSTWQKLTCREELVETIILTLIKKGEICGTKVIAENIARTEAGKISNYQEGCSKQSMDLLCNALKKANEISQKTGPLVWIKIEKNYYQTVENKIIPNRSQIKKVKYA